MKMLLIITFVISILAKHVLCLAAETPFLTDKNNTKNDTIESNIHEEKTIQCNTTQNNTNFSEILSAVREMSIGTITAIVAVTIVSTIVVTAVGIGVCYSWHHLRLPLKIDFPQSTPTEDEIQDTQNTQDEMQDAQNTQDETELPRTRIVRRHFPNETEPGRVEREAHIQDEIELPSERIQRETHIQDEIQLQPDRISREIHIQDEIKLQPRIDRETQTQTYI